MADKEEDKKSPLYRSDNALRYHMYQKKRKKRREEAEE